MQYNVVIRPGDIIRVPAPVAGNVYIGGQISRPGTYFLPGDGDLNLKQLIISAGGLTGLAIPERVDLIRRVADNQEVTVRINFRDITNGRAPDFFLKPNDTINIGTSFIATPLAVFRNGFRASYGFGFILDRNFEQDVFQGVSDSN
jgi:polysaccharide export outer membrane protein